MKSGKNLSNDFIKPINQLSGPLIAEIKVLNMILAFLVVDYVAYCYKICQDTCKSTEWKRFKIQPKLQIKD